LLRYAKAISTGSGRTGGAAD